MTNDFTASSPSSRGLVWEPVCPVDTDPPVTSPGVNVFLTERHRNYSFQELEHARLGHVLNRAWNGEYESAKEVADDVKATASEVGITIVGEDEVDIGERWEDVFTVKGQELLFQTPV